MKQEAREALDRFLAEEDFGGKRLLGAILFGSSVREQFVPGKSDIDVVVVTEEPGYKRWSYHLQDRWQTKVDVSAGSAGEIESHYTTGEGQPYLWLFREGVVYRDDRGGTVSRLLGRLAEHSRATEVPIVSAPAWRFTLTNRCNFACFFCHGEGLDAGGQYERPDFDQIYGLILQGVHQDCRDYTLTGGEPLLYRDEIVSLLDKLARHPAKPAITIVTNGLLLNGELIRALQSYGNSKVNVSFHSTKKAVYQKVIQRQGDEFERVLENIRALGRAGIVFNLNYVLLRHLNDSADQIGHMLDLAKETGARAVKFLELLVTDKLVRYFECYSDVRRVEELLRGRLRLVRDSWGRRREYALDEGGLLIFVQRCRCRWGCAQCADFMDRIITPDLRYEPCFTANEHTVGIGERELPGVFQEGDRIIAAMAERYGAGSPLIVREPELCHLKENYFYHTPRTVSEIDCRLREDGWRPVRAHDFCETYYRPADSDASWNDLQSVCKSYSNAEFPEKHRLFIAHREYGEGSGSGFRTLTRFSSEGMREFDEAQLGEYVQRLGLTPWISLSWKLRYFVREGVELSVGLCLGKEKVVVCAVDRPAARDVQEKYELQPITEALPKWLEAE